MHYCIMCFDDGGGVQIFAHATAAIIIIINHDVQES